MTINCEAISNRMLIKHFPEIFSLSEAEQKMFKQTTIRSHLNDIECDVASYLLKKYRKDVNDDNLTYYQHWTIQYLIGIGANYLTLADNNLNDNIQLLYSHNLYDYHVGSFDVFEDILYNQSKQLCVDYWGRAIINNKFYYISFHTMSKAIMNNVERNLNHIYENLSNVNVFDFLFSTPSEVVQKQYFDALEKISQYSMNRVSIIDDRLQKMNPFVVEIPTCSNIERAFALSSDRALQNVNLETFYEDCCNLTTPHGTSLFEWYSRSEAEKAELWALEHLY